MSPKWPDHEAALMEAHYADMGPAAMHRVFLPHRSIRAIGTYAHRRGLLYAGPTLGCNQSSEVSVPLPRMDPPESAECARLAQWRGPVNRGLPLRWGIAA